MPHITSISNNQMNIQIPLKFVMSNIWMEINYLEDFSENLSKKDAHWKKIQNPML